MTGRWILFVNSNGEYAVVEMQVVDSHMTTGHALGYVAAFYGKQMRR
jgi:hypothetical protein